jgi:hypothetical protein
MGRLSEEWRPKRDQFKLPGGRVLLITPGRLRLRQIDRSLKQNPVISPLLLFYPLMLYIVCRIEPQTFYREIILEISPPFECVHPDFFH